MKTALIVPVRLILSLLCAPRLWAAPAHPAARAEVAAPLSPWQSPSWQTPAYLRRQHSRDAIRRWP